MLVCEHMKHCVHMRIFVHVCLHVHACECTGIHVYTHAHALYVCARISAHSHVPVHAVLSED